MRSIIIYPCLAANGLPDTLLNAVKGSLPSAMAEDKAESWPVLFHEVQRDVTRVFDEISAKLSSVEIADTTIVLPGVNGDELCVLKDKGWGTLCAMLVLAFPEFRFVITNTAKWGMASLVPKVTWPLTDASGLRESIKKVVKKEFEDDKQLDDFIPKREYQAFCLDDESETSCYLAYIAYRFGFRSFAPRGYEETCEMLKDSNVSPLLSFEDLYLSFPDNPTDKTSLSCLEERSDKKNMPELEGIKHRTIVTVGTGDLRGNGDPYSRGAENEAYIQAQKAEGKLIKIIAKPLGGIFSFWQEAQAKKRLKQCWKKILAKIEDPKIQRDWRRALNGNATRGLYAPGFFSPPLSKLRHMETGNHSTPGRLLHIAQSLISRAEKMAAKSNTLESSVHGAVLATEALELLGGKTPMTSLEALTLKHQFEVQAECHFAGVEHAQDLRPRFKEIRAYLDFISLPYSRKRRKEFKINAELLILNRLINVFQEYHELDEAELCRCRVRTLHRQSWVRKSPYGFWEYVYWPLKMLVWPFRAYAEKLVGSISVFLLMIILWVAGIGGAVELVMRNAPMESFELRKKSENREKMREHCDGFETTQDSFQQAFKMMVGDDLPGHEKHGGNVAITWLLAIMRGSGLFHLGIFLAHLYTLISRR